MSVAALTPRVRTIVICDDVSASLTENGVFTLEGVRLHLAASSFPCRAALSLFLLLSTPRKGRYAGKILVINERTDWPIRYVKFAGAFREDNELLPLYVEVGECVFPEAGPYSFEIYFSARAGGEALKGEHPFTVLSQEEGAMARKTAAPPRIAPLQCVIAEPITDPAEQAALDKIRKREKRKKGGPKAKMTRTTAKAAAPSAAKKRG